MNELRFETERSVSTVEGLTAMQGEVRELVLRYVLEKLREQCPGAHFYTSEGRLVSPLEAVRLNHFSVLHANRAVAPLKAPKTRYSVEGDMLIAVNFDEEGNEIYRVSTTMSAVRGKVSPEEKEREWPAKPSQQRLRISLPLVNSPFLQTGVPFEELSRHCTPNDAWISIDGYVYDITHYLSLHPGGPILARFLGKEAGEQFGRYHRWVNHRELLRNCFIGRLRLL